MSGRGSYKWAPVEQAVTAGTVRLAEIPGLGLDSAQQIGVDVWKTDVLEFLRRF